MTDLSCPHPPTRIELAPARDGGPRTFFSADLHLGHANIIRYSNRPFETVSDMDEALIERWNATVGVDDTVWVIGDVSLGRLNQTLPLVGRLNGHLHLVAGNHDRCWGGHKKGQQARRLYLAAGFESVQDRAVVILDDGSIVTVNHFPFQGDEHDGDRFDAFRPVDHGQWLIHGHVHEAWKVRGRQINVGVDVWDYAPVAADELLAIMGAGAC